MATMHPHPCDLVLPVDVWAMEAGHLDAVYAIEAETFRTPWQRHELERLSSDAGAFGMRGLVAMDRGGSVAGYAVVGIDQAVPSLKVYSLAVARGCRRRGVGRQLLAWFARQLSHRGGYREALAHVAAGNLPAQVFFRACGWSCIRIDSRWFINPDGSREDAYVFRCGDR